MECLAIDIWRRARDSNPRYPLRYVGFQDRCHQPLGQLSAISKIPSLEKPSHPGSYGLSTATSDLSCAAGSRSAPLPALAASSSESVPVLSAKSTVPRESLTISSAGWFFTNRSGGVLPFADVFLIFLPPARWMRNSALVPKTGQTIPFREPFRYLPLSPTFRREYICP